MRQIHLATTSERKYKNLERHLASYKIDPYNIEIVWDKIEIPEPRSEDVEIVAVGKVLYAHRKIKKDCVAWDTGFYIPSLNGFPGTFVHYVIDKIGAEGILKLIEGKSRECEFRHCLTYLDTEMGEKPEVFSVSSKGSLADSLEGLETEWGLHRIFIPNGWNKTVVEIIDNGKYQEYRDQRYRDFFKDFVDWINERHDWLEH